jgi:Tfp pilus assembly protein PilN
MMRRIDLLPQRFVARRRERRNVAVILAVGVLLLLLLIGWWVLVQMNIGSEKERLETAQARNAQLNAQIAELQEFALLDAEVQAKRQALESVMAGDIRWPAILSEIAMVIPGEVSLQTVSASSASAVGGAPVGTETAAIRISNQDPVGRIQFSGESLTMPGVARWLIRLGGGRPFHAAYLTSASATQEEGAITSVNFSNTVELGEASLSRRFQGGAQQ